MTSLSLFALAVGIAKNHSDAPQTGNTHQCVDNAADGTHLAAKEKGNGVKAEQKPTLPQFSAPITMRISAILSIIFKKVTSLK